MKKRTRIILLIIAVLAVITSFACRQFYGSSVLHNSRFGFQFYTPLELPPGFQITASRINVFSDAGKTNGISADMDLRPADWVFGIQESKYMGEIFHTTLSNFNTTSVKPTCNQETSADKRSYRLCHWIDNGRISVYEIKFVQDGTFIDTTLPASLRQNVPLAAINAYVDSFVTSSPPKKVVTGF